MNQMKHDDYPKYHKDNIVNLTKQADPAVKNVNGQNPL